MKKCSAAFILVCVMFGVFFDILVSADYSENISEEITEIRSIIPFIERSENNIRQNLPIESREDILASGSTASLRIQVYISESDAQSYYGQSLFIHRLRTFEDTTAVSPENIAGSFEVRSDGSFTYNLFIVSDFSNLNSGEIYNKFVISARTGEDFTPISNARYIGNINHLSNRRDVPPVSRSIKGLTAVHMPGEARLLGVRHTTVTMILNNFMAAEPSANTETYMFGGEEFHFNMDIIAEYDRKIRYFTNEGINVTAVLVISAVDYVHPQLRPGADGGASGEDESDGSEEDSERETGGNLLPIDHLIHRSALENPAARPFYFGINTADEYGFKYFAALMSFIADRYVREDSGNGRIYNIILGSEIGNINMNYCGPVGIEQYVRDYLRALRIADTAVRSRFGGARVYVPFDNWFADKPDDGFVNRQIIDLLLELSAQEGNFVWNVAINAYNADISNLRNWTETEPYITGNFDTPIISMRNIEVLRDYLNVEKRAYLADGQARKIMLANQGFTSGDYSSREGMELQAASFIYAYIRARSIPEITAFIYHGQVDNPSEEPGFFGLWTETGNPKLIHDVFKYMDTNKEAQTIEFAKAILNIESFTEIAPPISAPAVMLTETTGQSRARMSSEYIGRFNTAALGGFIGSKNMSDIALKDYANENEDADSSFRQVLFAGFTAPRRGDFGSIFRVFEPGNYLDLSERSFVGVNLRIDSDLDLAPNHPVQIILTLESDRAEAESLHVYEGIANIRLNVDTAVFFDISDWDERANITRISLSANPYADAYPGRTGSYDFRMYVQSIVSANISRMGIIRNIITVIVIIILLLAAAWLALFIRARIIRARRRRERAEQLRQRKRQAARKRASANGQPQPPPGNRR